MIDSRSILCVVAIVAIAGCGSTGSSSSASNASVASAASDATSQPASTASPAAIAKEACDVLTPVIAKATLGPAAVLKRKFRPNAHMTQCQYTGGGGAANIEYGDAEFMKQFGAAGTGRPVAGIGDEALLFPGNSLYVRRGANAVMITLFLESGTFSGSAADNQDARNLAASKKFAQALLANM